MDILKGINSIGTLHSNRTEGAKINGLGGTRGVHSTHALFIGND